MAAIADPPMVEGREMKLDATCYLILVEEAARLQPDES